MNPIIGMPDDVISDVVDAVDDIVDDSYVEKFCFCTTDDYEKRAPGLGADDVVPVYKTESVNHAMDVEESLLDVFRDDPRCKNGDECGGGGASVDGVQYVCVAVWMSG